MRRRVLCLGNSHVAMIRDAAQRFGDGWPDLSVTCVGAHRELLLETTCADGWLRPATDAAREAFALLGGGNRVELDGFDAIVVVGCQASATRATEVWKDTRTATMTSVRRHDDPATADWALVSQAAFDAMVQTTLLETLAFRLLRHLRRGTGAPLLLVSQPRLSQKVHEVPAERYPGLHALLQSGDAPAISEAHDRNAEVLCEALGVTYLPQPEMTIREAMLTARAFSHGGKKLTEAGEYRQPPEDVLHGNATYARRVLDQIAAHFGLPPEPRQPV